ncbi:CusA/CzcA family heavy metal efflux RND transporter [Rhizosphaericola mali]|uniref:CusA/CzcA family heavy metal efflux RND transporter n=1 Tax=Rhizosphaericola mali TaxID=2545455 RepID=A0A5P2G451_9BACT|nr:CusA/CzcA family heavy metal efflux RND transporter [Rhizosphaericola mali]QES87883.1 CusA/CzcA family heavy metal efflux RND transporter [Rhizosphaericola mali]
MLNKIIQFSLKNKLIVILLVLGLIGYGSYSVTQLPIDAVPDITNNQVMVITSSPSLSAPDIERFLTVPIEQATRNVPGIIEQRSFSRFGLSIVTIVFDESTDVYWARQQISERLAQVQQEIPSGMGTPTLGPVSTGLGEIYQYVVRPLPGYERKYDLAKLREIQDWIVRRQLLGTPGVADVSSFGGNLKQYEVSISPEKLQAFHLTIEDVYAALQANNQNAGGAYIEKGPQTLFIRSDGLVSNLDAISKIVVKKSGISPILIRDVANVQYGHAIKYGAMVFNGEGEVSGAVVMMLKGANSSQVIKDIKAKVTEIQKTLPKGVKIEAFLDRTKMVNNAISTVEHNLMEGAIIVVFVLVLFLGNIRAGLIVASVIPLAMLFAIILMNLFGVSGNLMSLGALDFGMIIDGAVIIVEAVMHHIRYSKDYQHAMKLSGAQMDSDVQHASERMMHSAAFGQIIILIVYLPILSLEGIEGKMFRPMAQTVAFAVIGAFLLSLTYIPVVTSLVLNKKVNHKDNLSDRWMNKIAKVYLPVLKRTLQHSKIVVTVAFVCFAGAVYLMTTLGGEFIPQLEEGDFAIDTRLLSGTSLTHTVEVTKKTAGLLKDSFPEVQKVVVKIGSGEIPTDPMPMNAADMMVILKPKSQWTSAHSFPELADKMSKVLSNIPEVAVGFSYPVQMRFNELMTGSKQDVVCKIFGDDLDTLSNYNDQLMRIIKSLKGAKDLYQETVTGIGQLVVRYNRDALARYGVSISEVNQTLQTAYAGASAGFVFEGDKRFDLVVRMNDHQKMDINEIQNLQIPLSDGTQIPLNQLATIKIEDGPYQIQREDARRRITAGFNVRGRDIESIVNELQQKVQQKLKLPAGYYITFGGQYENLQHATARLQIAVPIALLLIYLILFFAFQQLRYCTLIFSAIPLSIIGGVVALWIRGLPFSISAGVGFIALFGVAVLNGIVLITEMNRIHSSEKDIVKVILQATSTRLRPVLMTAAVASLGFLPMAMSNGAGAEVQRPLATVVIGGLITATLLTLLVLPCLYLLIETRKAKKDKMKIAPILPILLIGSFVLLENSEANAQRKLSLQEALSIAKENNLQISASKLNEKYNQAMTGTAAMIPNTQITGDFGQVNSWAFDNKFSIAQSFSLPSVYKKQKQVLLDQWNASQLQTKIQQATVAQWVRTAYLQIEYTVSKQKLLKQIDSIYSQISKVAQLRHQEGESTILEKTTLENEVHQLQLQYQLVLQDQTSAQAQLSALLNLEELPIATDTLNDSRIIFDTSMSQSHPLLAYYKSLQILAKDQTVAEKSKLTPDITLGYNNQSFVGWQADRAQVDHYYNAGRRFNSGQLGLAIPIFNKAQKNKIRAAKMGENLAEANAAAAEQSLKIEMQKVYFQYQKDIQAVDYFQKIGKNQADIITKNAALQYKNGEINYLDWLQLMRNAITIYSSYIDQLNAFQLDQIQLQYFLSQNEN